jgi:hypothetical protein
VIYITSDRALQEYSNHRWTAAAPRVTKAGDGLSRAKSFFVHSGEKKKLQQGDQLLR